MFCWQEYLLTYKQTIKQTNKQTSRQTDRHTDILTDKYGYQRFASKLSVPTDDTNRDLSLKGEMGDRHIHKQANR